MAKRALLCGCNYPGSDAALKGCVNDVLSVRAMLTELYGFDSSDITVLIDTDPQYPKPTGANIKAKLAELVQVSVPGDVIYFHFSGHGTQVPTDDLNEKDRKDEAICPADMNVICDDDLRAILINLQQGVKFTMIADCCHSGTLLDHPQVQISGSKDPGALGGDLGGLASLLMNQLRDVDESQFKNRALPTSKFMSMLSALAGSPVAQGHVRGALTSVFGDAASVKAVKYVEVAQKMLSAVGGDKARTGGTVSQLLGMGLSALNACCGNQSSGAAQGEPNLPIQHAPGGGTAPPTNIPHLPDDVGILISGCQAHETSADACPGGDPSKAYGALTNALTTIIRQHHQVSPGQPITYRDLVTKVRASLGQARFTQNPCLECSDRNADTPFILPAVPAA